MCQIHRIGICLSFTYSELQFHGIIPLPFLISLMAKRSGPKSQYTDEQDKWLDQAKVEFIKLVKSSNNSRWEAKWKADKAKEFVENFASTLDGEPEKWATVRAN
jgi:hypothetical protein